MDVHESYTIFLEEHVEDQETRAKKPKKHKFIELMRGFHEGEKPRHQMG